MKDFRQWIGKKIAGDSLQDSVRCAGTFTLASYVNDNEDGKKLRAAHELDRFVEMVRDRERKLPVRIEQFLDEVVSDPFKFDRLYSLGYGNNKLVNDGTRMMNRWFTDIATNSAAGNAITTRVSRLQLGTDGTTTHLSTYTGCVAPLTTPSGLAEAVGAVTQVTTNASYTFDTVQLRKTDFQNNTGGGTPVTVREAAIRNNDAVKICWCRSATTATIVADTGNLDVTYQFQWIVG